MRSNACGTMTRASAFKRRSRRTRKRQCDEGGGRQFNPDRQHHFSDDAMVAPSMSWHACRKLSDECNRLAELSVMRYPLIQIDVVAQCCLLQSAVAACTAGSRK